MPYLEWDISNIAFQQNTNNSKPQRILSSEAGMKTMLLQMTEDHVTQAIESELGLLQRTVTILRSISFDFRESKNSIFKGSVTLDYENAPLELETNDLLAGTKDLNTTINDQVKCLAGSVSQIILCNMKSERQTQYIPKTDLHALRKFSSNTANRQLNKQDWS